MLEEKVGILKGLDGELLVPGDELEEQILREGEYMEGVYAILAKLDGPGAPRPSDIATPRTDPLPPNVTDPRVSAGTRTEHTSVTKETTALEQ